MQRGERINWNSSDGQKGAKGCNAKWKVLLPGEYAFLREAYRGSYENRLPIHFANFGARFYQGRVDLDPRSRFVPASLAAKGDAAS